MDVEQAVGPAIDEIFGQQAHKTGAANQLNIGGAQGFIELGVKRLAAVETFVVNHRAGNTCRFANFNATGIGAIGNGQHQFGGHIGFAIWRANVCILLPRPEKRIAILTGLPFIRLWTR